eukprot:CAMPEP_0115004154 /NCGR_PEP_ID=MMETSP0216-20121206/19030_1 /TAXON_ID=223996 /ORGANISM="Protocruzia adherens, Strain Boccale" /LENGTH=846 /DNA_ID=CAMNT_0002370081 /DNA_START=306 /DNA_END=2846 /DNA_ORIENTATION=-
MDKDEDKKEEVLSDSDSDIDSDEEISAENAEMCGEGQLVGKDPLQYGYGKTRNERLMDEFDIEIDEFIEKNRIGDRGGAGGLVGAGLGAFVGFVMLTSLTLVGGVAAGLVGLGIGRAAGKKLKKKREFQLKQLINLQILTCYQWAKKKEKSNPEVRLLVCEKLIERTCPALEYPKCKQCVKALRITKKYLTSDVNHGLLLHSLEKFRKSHKKMKPHRAARKLHLIYKPLLQILETEQTSKSKKLRFEIQFNLERFLKKKSVRTLMESHPLEWYSDISMRYLLANAASHDAKNVENARGPNGKLNNSFIGRTQDDLAMLRPRGNRMRSLSVGCDPNIITRRIELQREVQQNRIKKNPETLRNPQPKKTGLKSIQEVEKELGANNLMTDIKYFEENNLMGVNDYLRDLEYPAEYKVSWDKEFVQSESNTQTLKKQETEDSFVDPSDIDPTLGSELTEQLHLREESFRSYARQDPHLAEPSPGTLTTNNDREEEKEEESVEDAKVSSEGGETPVEISLAKEDSGSHTGGENEEEKQEEPKKDDQEEKPLTVLTKKISIPDDSAALGNDNIKGDHMAAVEEVTRHGSEASHDEKLGSPTKEHVETKEGTSKKDQKAYRKKLIKEHSKDFVGKFDKLITMEAEDLVKHWIRVVSNNFITIYKRRHAAGGVNMVMAFVELEGIPSEVVYRAIYDQDIRQKWDKVFKTFKTIPTEEKEANTDVVFFTLRSPIGVSDREFLQRRRCLLDYPLKGDRMIHFESIELDQVPVGRRNVRAWTSIAGYIIREDPEDPCKVKMTIVSQVDVKGVIPKAIVNMVAAKAPAEWAKNLVKGCHEVMKDTHPELYAQLNIKKK